jgi:hypothetical protein
MTFAIVAIAMVAFNLWSRDRSKLVREIEWLRQQISHPEKFVEI